MQGPRNLIVAAVAGAATALAFAPLNLWPLGLVGLALFAHLVVTADSGWAAAGRGWLFGTAMFAVSLNWIATSFTYQAKMPAALGWVAVIGLAMYLALFVALPAGMAVRLAKKPVARALWLVALWPLAETLRGTLLTGFAWNPAGAMWLETPVAQLASVVGSTGLSILALACGMAHRLITDAVAYAKERKQFGQPIADFQLIQAMLADSQAELYAGMSMVRDCARRYDAKPVGKQDHEVSMLASCTKMFCTEMVGRVADRAVQIHGGAGYIAEYKAERFYRDVRLLRLYEGTTQIQQLIIAKNLLRD